MIDYAGHPALRDFRRTASPCTDPDCPDAGPEHGHSTRLPLRPFLRPSGETFATRVWRALSTGAGE